MAYNFRACDRDQAFLLPPDVRDWLPTDHLASRAASPAPAAKISMCIDELLNDGPHHDVSAV